MNVLQRIFFRQHGSEDREMSSLCVENRALKWGWPRECRDQRMTPLCCVEVHGIFVNAGLVKDGNFDH